MQDITRELVELMDLAPIGDDHFQGQSEDLGFPNLFGGHVLGQALMASTRTIEGRMPHSMHAYFLRPGNARAPIDYEVQRVRDGGSFSVRRVIARQDGKEILTGSVSEAPTPESLRTEQELNEELLDKVPEKFHEQLTRNRPIEIRPVDPVNPLAPEIKPPQKQSWFRAQGGLPDDPILHRCLLAYASDFAFLGTSLNPHGVAFMTPNMQVASLDHAIWFHRDLRMDDWLLYHKDSPSASEGRGFNRGSVYNREGVLVASTAQEALIRRRKSGK